MHRYLVFFIFFFTTLSLALSSVSQCPSTKSINHKNIYCLPDENDFRKISEEVSSAFERKLNLSSLQKASIMSIVCDLLKNMNNLSRAFKHNNNTNFYSENFINCNKAALNSIKNILGKNKSVQLQNLLNLFGKDKETCVQALFIPDMLSREATWTLYHIFFYHNN